jgi:aminopeptidase-like protein
VRSTNVRCLTRPARIFFEYARLNAYVDCGLQSSCSRRRCQIPWRKPPTNMLIPKWSPPSEVINQMAHTSSGGDLVGPIPEVPECTWAGSKAQMAESSADSPCTVAPAVDAAGEWMYGLVQDLYPLCRSITGDGVRATFRRLQREIPLTVNEVPTGTRVFDWAIPPEWNIRDAYIKNHRGERVIDFARCNLHVVSYSEPLHQELSRDELKRHLFTIPEHPDWIPYRTSYYQRGWGFCVSHNQLATLVDETYEVCIDSSFTQGSLTYAEHYLPGERSEEVLISCHVCHPSLCNDNLSGIALATALARHLQDRPRRYSYRFLYVPGTIGSIAWLGRHQQHVHRVAHGLVAACVGDPGAITYKRSRRGNAEIDRAVEHVLKHSGAAYHIIDFSPYGYDERQYCSPGFDLPVGCLMRTPHGQFPEYHTSADNLDLVRPAALVGSFATYLATVELLESNRTYINVNPYCEPQLAKYGLDSVIQRHAEPATFYLALLWVLNLSEGQTPLLGIAERANLPFDMVRHAARALEQASLIREVAEGSPTRHRALPPEGA